MTDLAVADVLERTLVDRGIGHVDVRLAAAGLPFRPLPGDLVVGFRRSPIQRLNTLSGDSLTHSGLLFSDDGVLFVGEHGARGAFRRPFEEFAGRYEVVGLARPSMSDACRAAVAEEMRRRVAAGSTTYSWVMVALIGCTGLWRRLVPARWQVQATEVAARVARRVLDAMSPDRVTCSSFVASCFDVACESCRITVHWPARRRVRPWRGMLTPTDTAPTRLADIPVVDSGELARRMSTPSDLWASPSLALRVVVREDHATVRIDVDERPAAAVACRRHGSAAA